MMNRLSVALTINDILRLVNIKYAEDIGKLLDELKRSLMDDQLNINIVGDRINLPPPPLPLKVVPQGTATPRAPDQTGHTGPTIQYGLREPPFLTLPIPEFPVTGDRVRWLYEQTKQPKNLPISSEFIPAREPSGSPIHVTPIGSDALQPSKIPTNLHNRLRIDGKSPISKEELLTQGEGVAFFREVLKLLSNNDDERYQSAIYNYSLTAAQQQTINNFLELKNRYHKVIGLESGWLARWSGVLRDAFVALAEFPFQSARLGLGGAISLAGGNPGVLSRQPGKSIASAIAWQFGGAAPEQVAYTIFGEAARTSSDEWAELIDAIGSLGLGAFAGSFSWAPLKIYRWFATTAPLVSMTDLSFLDSYREPVLKNTSVYVSTVPAQEGGQSAFGFLSLHGGPHRDPRYFKYLLMVGSRSALGIWPDDVESPYIAVADYMAELGAETVPTVIKAFREQAKTDKPILPECVMPFVLSSPLLVPSTPATTPVYSQVKAREIIKLSLDTNDNTIRKIVENDRYIEGVTGDKQSPAEIGQHFVADKLNVQDEHDISYVVAPALISTRYIAGPIVGAGGVMKFRDKPVTVITEKEIENMKLSYEEFVRYLFRTLSHFDLIGHEQIYDFESKQRVNGRPLIGFKEDVLQDEEKFKRAMNDVVKFNILLEWYQNIELPRLAEQHFASRGSNVADVFTRSMPQGMHRLLVSEIISREIINGEGRLYLFGHTSGTDRTLDMLIVNNVFDRSYVARHIALASGDNKKIAELLVGNVARYSPTLAGEVAGLLRTKGWPELVNYIYSPLRIAGTASSEEQPALRIRELVAKQAALSLVMNVNSHYAVSTPMSPRLAFISSLAGNKFILTPGTVDYLLGSGRNLLALAQAAPLGKWIPRFTQSVFTYGGAGLILSIESQRSHSAAVDTLEWSMGALNRSNDSMLNALNEILKKSEDIKK